MSPANLNGAGQVVIAGSRDAVARAGDRAKALGAKRVIPLPVSAPFHCALMKPAEDRLAPELRALDVHDPGVPIVANVDAELKRDAASAIEALVRRSRRRCGGKRWCGALRPRASQRMLRWVRARC